MNMNTLKPFESGSNAIENGRKGGLKSVEERRKKKFFKEVVKDILSQKPNNEEIQDLINKYPSLDIEEITYRTLLIDTQIKKALKGDTKACEFILSVSGEKPKEIEEEHEIKLPIFNIEVIDNSELKKKWAELEQENSMY